MHRTLYVIGIGYLAICGMVYLRARQANASAGPTGMPPTSSTAPSSGAAWFAAMKPLCNVVEVEVAQRTHPAPATLDGQGYSAACYALAGKIGSARAVIDRVRPEDRYMAAGIVFDVGHPVADAGDNRSAGPIMELVLEYWPNHYMALYHAGMAEYGLGQTVLARQHLASFLQYYRREDGWTKSARMIFASLQ